MKSVFNSDDTLEMIVSKLHAMDNETALNAAIGMILAHLQMHKIDTAFEHLLAYAYYCDHNLGDRVQSDFITLLKKSDKVN